MCRKLGSVAGRRPDAHHMSNSLFLLFTLLVVGAAVLAFVSSRTTEAKSRGVVTGMRVIRAAGTDYCEVELDLMVRGAVGGQFPARRIATVPASWLANVGPGSVIDVIYQRGDESAVAVCVPPSAALTAPGRWRS
jgi:hypothetical protein